MENRNFALVILMASALLLFGCVNQQTPPAPAPTPQPPAPAPASPAAATVKVSSNPQFGNILTDGNGMTLYVFTKDEIGKTNCYGKCSSLWPPLVTQGGKVNGSLPGTLQAIARTDGSQQAAYNGMPLYLFSSDKNPGDVLGQGVAGAWFVAQPNMTAFPSPAITGGSFNTDGNVLISDQYNNRVIEVNPVTNEIVWSFGSGNPALCKPGPGTIIGPNWAERLPNGLTLIAGTGISGCADNRVIVVNQTGDIVWQYGQANVTGFGPNELNVPVAAIRLQNGNFLITDQGNNRIIEVDGFGRIAWSFGPSSPPSALNSPNSAQVLENGNVLIADENNNRVIEIARNGDIAWEYNAGIQAAAFADRLPNNDTLIADSGNSRILVVTPGKQVAYQYFTNASSGSNPVPLPTNAVMLRNGNMMIADEMNHRVFEINPQNQTVWQYGTTNVLGNESGLLNGPYTAFVIGDYTGQNLPSSAPVPRPGISMGASGYLADSGGMALYFFTKDAAGSSSCTGGCLAKWPAFYAENPVVSGANLADFGTITRSNGAKQITFNGWPLYYYSGDKAPGDANGEGFAKLWYLAKDYSVMLGTKGNDTYLADQYGKTLYYYTPDSPGASTCSGGCINTWPAFTAGTGIYPSALNSSDFQAITRSDGRTQTTYKGAPLYYYAGDNSRGEMNGQGYGGVWHIISPDGRPAPPPPPPPQSDSGGYGGY